MDENRPLEKKDAKAIGMATLVITLALSSISPNESKQAEITARLVDDASARKAFRPCDVTINQYGPGERWMSPSLPSCASFAGAVPNNVLTSPVAQ